MRRIHPQGRRRDGEGDRQEQRRQARAVAAAERRAAEGEQGQGRQGRGQRAERRREVERVDEQVEQLPRPPPEISAGRARRGREHAGPEPPHPLAPPELAERDRVDPGEAREPGRPDQGEPRRAAPFPPPDRPDKRDDPDARQHEHRRVREPDRRGPGRRQAEEPPRRRRARGQRHQPARQGDGDVGRVLLHLRRIINQPIRQREHRQRDQRGRRAQIAAREPLEEEQRGDAGQERDEPERPDRVHRRPARDPFERQEAGRGELSGLQRPEEPGERPLEDVPRERSLVHPERTPRQVLRHAERDAQPEDERGRMPCHGGRERRPADVAPHQARQPARGGHAHFPPASAEGSSTTR